jgi:hypothetical protein
LKMLKGSMVGSNEESKFTMFHLWAPSKIFLSSYDIELILKLVIDLLQYKKHALDVSIVFVTIIGFTSGVHQCIRLKNLKTFSYSLLGVHINHQIGSKRKSIGKPLALNLLDMCLAFSFSNQILFLLQ